jgi:hypothetical protein
MSDNPLEPLIKSGAIANENAAQVGKDLLAAKASTKSNASATENLGPLQSEGASATGAGTGTDMGVGSPPGEPLLDLEALRDLRKTAGEAAAKVRDRLAEITSEMSQAGATVERFGADFDRFWEDWSCRFLRNEAKPAFDARQEQTKNMATEIAGPGSASIAQAGQLVDVASAQCRPSQAAVGESAAAVSLNLHKDFEPQTPEGVAEIRPEEGVQPKSDPAAPDGDGAAGIAGQTQFANMSGNLESGSQLREPANRKLSNHGASLEQTSPRKAVAGFGQDDATNQFATARSIADTLNRGGTLDAAPANLLILIEQTIAGHQRTLEQAVKLIEAQSSNAHSTLNLLGNAYTKIEAVHARLEQLEASHTNSRITLTSG